MDSNSTEQIPTPAPNYTYTPPPAYPYTPPPYSVPPVYPYPPPYPPPAYVYAPVPKPENLFKPDVRDFVFALVVFVFGYLFSRWVLFAWEGWGVTAFTVAYLLASTWYMANKGTLQRNVATWFWLGVTLLVGASYAVWDNAGFNGYRSLFLFGSAAYYIIVASGNTLMGKTSNFLIVDAFKTVIILPFRNFFNQYVSFKALGKPKKGGKILPILLGAFIAFILLSILIPMLEQADIGGFSRVMSHITDILKEIYWLINWNTVVYIMLGIPVAAYIYGLISGVAHKKGTSLIKLESAQKTVAALRITHTATIFTVLGAICAVYAVFILSQLPYFFSAFAGERPDGWLIYSEYARRGFFELCTIAVINLAVITASNVTSRKLRTDLRVLKIFNITLACITLLLIATAFSKMALYISVYGLTMPRLLPCIFMVFLAIVFIALIVLQKWDFSIVRFALVTGAIIMCVISFANPDAIVVRYNADRYLKGTLSTFDTEVLYRAGDAGVLPALDVLEKTQDAEVKEDIQRYIDQQISFMRDKHRSRERLGNGYNTYSVESYLAEKAYYKTK